eukprot:gene12268-13983_t
MSSTDPKYGTFAGKEGSESHESLMHGGDESAKVKDVLVLEGEEENSSNTTPFIKSSGLTSAQAAEKL